MGAEDALDPVLRLLVRQVPAGGLHVDLGCGRGRLLMLSQQAGNAVLGIDNDPASVRYCESRGVPAVLADVQTGLAAVTEPIEAVSAVHFVEHVQPAELDELFAAVSARLVDNGRFALVTPNFRDWRVASEIFWLDPTHVRPYPLPLLKAMGARHELLPLFERTLYGCKGGVRLRASLPIRRIVFGSEYGRMNAVLILEKRRG